MQIPAEPPESIPARRRHSWRVAVLAFAVLLAVQPIFCAGAFLVFPALTAVALLMRPRVSPWLFRLYCALIVASLPLHLAFNLWMFHRAGQPIRDLGGDVRASGDGMNAMSGIRGVNYISLAGTPTDDDDLARLTPHLAALPQISLLDLSGTRITDRAIASLSRIKATQVFVFGTQMTRDGSARLKDARPKSHIVDLDPRDEAARRVEE